MGKNWGLLESGILKGGEKGVPLEDKIDFYETNRPSAQAFKAKFPVKERNNFLRKLAYSLPEKNPNRPKMIVITHGGNVKGIMKTKTAQNGKLVECPLSLLARK